MSSSQAAIVADFSRALAAAEFSFGDRLIHCLLRAISSAHILGIERYPTNQAGWKSKLQKASSAMKLGWQPRKWLEKKTKRGIRGYPIGTIAYYGPDNRRATKVAVSIIPAPDAELTDMRRWFAETGDLRTDDAIIAEIAAFLRENDVKSVAAMDGIFGCPHEEGIDYPVGEACPACSYWNGRNRFTGKLEAD
ncbi:hypothetical protein [Rhizobium sp. BT03]|uniref:hypothetical protein n=1 Tax=Rhizobium sp. BT03 TaxID=3045156 RepID=UPI0024B3D8C1|nr:hypothetical protein [Rhizobium sp. BT03]WHO71420.1 hypothetical protein QMO80_000409 [Rhizobium sp. BT03]